MLGALSSTFLILFLLFIITSIITPTSSSSALGNKTDRIALLKLRESISSDPSEQLASWNSYNHFCNWHGVKCGNNKRVTKLNLTGYWLHGYIPPHVGNLSFLRTLLLDNNRFSGEVPKELGSLFRLQSLNLSNNTLGGEFPVNLANCSKLRSLSLGWNNFSGQIPKEIDLLGKLEWMSLAENQFSGQIPSSIGNISSLTYLSLAYNYNLEGNIPDEMCQRLKNLATMYVDVNNLSGILPPSLFNMSSLANLAVSVNQFHGQLPSKIFLSLPNLKFIALGMNNFSGPIPASITNASEIQLFDIYQNQFVGQVPSLGKLKNLSYLGLDWNNLGSNLNDELDFFFKSLINCSQLNYLSICGNNFGGQFPNVVGNLSTQLRQLVLCDNQIYGKIPIGLGNLNNLISLDIEHNHLTETIPEAIFGNFHEMQSLELGGNKFSGEIPASIGNLSKLFQLSLAHNTLAGNVPSVIGNCRKLQVLDLSENNLTGAIPSQVIGLSSLSILNLSHNSLNGGLLKDVGMLKNIYWLDLSQNHLIGDIPETIGDCIGLQYLYLQGNSFHGIIPTSLASLKDLLLLDLSRNNLFGEIPEGLQSISDLAHFNASCNSLEGEVPTTGVFRNASLVSLFGNDKLCGGVLELKLPPCPSKSKRRRRYHHSPKQTVLIICLCLFLLFLSCFLTIFRIRKRHRKESAEPTIGQLPKVSYQSLHNATNGFSSTNLIGTGSLGFVYKGSLNSEEREVAIKVLNHQKKGAQESFIAECNALKNIWHRNLVKIFTCCSSVDYNGNEFKALVFEYMSNGSLEEWLHPDIEIFEKPRTLNLEKRLEIMIDVASALHYLHNECDQHIIHCDLKPSNVLLDDDMVAHVSDFGLATILSLTDDNCYKETSSSSIKGTIGYAPPEYGISTQVSMEGDMYRFGILLLEMLTGRSPTEELFKDEHNLHNYVKNAFPNHILEIVDATLLLVGNDEYPEVMTKEVENHVFKVMPHLLNPKIEKCLLSLFWIGLACSIESPRQRMNMMEVIRELNMIRKSFIA